MKIGIDLDDTIFNTTEKYKKYQKKYINKKKITEQELWSTREYRFDFIKSNFYNIFPNLSVKPYVKTTLRYLKNKGHEIIFITARSKRYNEDIYNVTLNSLIKNNLVFDKLILTEKYKLNECINNKIDIMIDNSLDVYNELKKEKIEFMLYDENNEYKVKNKVSSWKEILNKFKGV